MILDNFIFVLSAEDSGGMIAKLCSLLAMLIDLIMKGVEWLVAHILAWGAAHPKPVSWALMALLVFYIIRKMKSWIVDVNKESLSFPKVEELKAAEMNGNKIGANDGAKAGRTFLIIAWMILIAIAGCYVYGKGWIPV